MHEKKNKKTPAAGICTGLGTFLLLMKSIGCIQQLDEVLPELPESAYLVNEGKKVQRIRHRKL